MNKKELELRKDVETIGRTNFKFDWNMDTVVIAFTAFEDREEGLKKTLEYWNEFLKSKGYEEYWKSYAQKNYCRWEVHLDEVMYLFKEFIREKGKRK